MQMKDHLVTRSYKTADSYGDLAKYVPPSSMQAAGRWCSHPPLQTATVPACSAAHEWLGIHNKMIDTHPQWPHTCRHLASTMACQGRGVSSSCSHLPRPSQRRFHSPTTCPGGTGEVDVGMRVVEGPMRR